MDNKNGLDDTLAKQIEEYWLRFGEKMADDVFESAYQKWKRDKKYKQKTAVSNMYITAIEMMSNHNN